MKKELALGSLMVFLAGLTSLAAPEFERALTAFPADQSYEAGTTWSASPKNFRDVLGRAKPSAQPGS